MIFTVYSNCVEEVKKRLTRLAKKAERYNVPFSYSVGNEYPKEIAVYKVDPADRTTQYVAERRIVAAVDFDIMCESLIRANGWTVRAMIEHGDKGNIVTPFGAFPVPHSWYSVPAHCEHCKTKRRRTITYFVEHESGVFRQVGRSCLKDYTGISPDVAALWAAVRDLFPQDLSYYYGIDLAYLPTPMYPVQDILAHACDAIKEYGFHNSDSCESTRGEVLKRFHNHNRPSYEAATKAKEIIDWLLKDRDSNAYDLLDDCLRRDCSILASSGYSKAKHFGRLVYMPVVFKRHLEYLERKEARQREIESNPSDYIGEEGQRLVFDIKNAELVSSWENDYGRTYLYKFIDINGNVLVWYSSRLLNLPYGELSEAIKLKGTVKGHKKYDGVKQTIITRCIVMLPDLQGEKRA